ncbi:MAG: hypothetical protein HY369_01000 [Candidatus Aenigmarchaeota archaeon]|nr:hypothetical protein [Candidatus Aenigmarchaeota archaeon]
MGLTVVHLLLAAAALAIAFFLAVGPLSIFPRFTLAGVPGSPVGSIYPGAGDGGCTWYAPAAEGYEKRTPVAGNEEIAAQGLVCPEPGCVLTAGDAESSCSPRV